MYCQICISYVLCSRRPGRVSLVYLIVYTEPNMVPGLWLALINICWINSLLLKWPWRFFTDVLSPYLTLNAAIHDTIFTYLYPSHLCIPNTWLTLQHTIGANKSSWNGLNTRSFIRPAQRTQGMWVLTIFSKIRVFKSLLAHFTLTWLCKTGRSILKK